MADPKYELPAIYARRADAISTALTLPDGLPAKAVGSGGTGAGVVALTYDVPISSIANNPQRKAREAMAAFRTPWVFTAERAVSSVASTVGWHLENDQNETLGQEGVTLSQPEQAALDFMEAPVKGLTRQQAWALTMRHTGLVGYAFWYLDQRDLQAGTPLQALYIRPDRMAAAEDKAGNLIGWVMDGDRPNGRQPVAFRTDEIEVFRLEPPDEGHLGFGLVEAMWRKLALSGTVDRHTEKMIGSGGRLPGIISPTAEKGSFSDDEYAQIVREMRNVTDSPDAAKKALIFKVPMDFKQTGANPSQLSITDLSRASRDDIFAGWGVALSTVGITSPRGLNSGDIPKFEEAATWQNAREPRLATLAGPLQNILDRYAVLGANLALELEVPSFDDDTPLYDIAEKAKVVPLSVNQRLALVGMDPLDPAVYGELGSAIYIDKSMVPLFSVTPVEQPAPVPPVKAGLDPKVRITWEPKIHARVLDFLTGQRKAIAAKVAGQAGHLATQPKDFSSWWNGAHWDRRLRDALLEAEEEMAVGVRAQVAKTLAPGKADPLNTLLNVVRDRAGVRITGINETTRDKIAALIEQGVEQGLSPAELGSLITDATAFDGARADLIARTETGTTMNIAAAATYRDYGVERVQIVDGDADDICAPVNGAIWTIDEFESNPLGHPNCTRDAIPLGRSA